VKDRDPTGRRPSDGRWADEFGPVDDLAASDCREGAKRGQVGTQGVIRCQFIILARKNEPTPDYALSLLCHGRIAKRGERVDSDDAAAFGF